VRIDPDHHCHHELSPDVAGREEGSATSGEANP